MRDANLSVDDIVALDVRFAGELGVPHGVGVILVAGLLLAVTENLSVAVTAVALALSERLPLDVVVRDVGPVDGLLAVIGGGEGGKSQENDSDLYRVDTVKFVYI